MMPQSYGANLTHTTDYGDGSCRAMGASVSLTRSMIGILPVWGRSLRFRRMLTQPKPRMTCASPRLCGFADSMTWGRACALRFSL